MNITYRAELDALSPYVPGRPIEDVAREYGLASVVKLASNENPYGCSPLAKAAAAGAVDSMYPDGSCAALRGALSRRLGVAPGRLAFGAGADELIAMLAKAFVCPGDEMVTAAVTFPQYAAAAAAMGGVTKTAPMTAGLGYDLGGLLGLITDKTKLIFIANPNNPTGTAFDAAEQAAFLEAVPPSVLVVLDEAYGEFAGGDYPDSIQAAANRPNVAVLRTFSKAYGLAGLRVGYMLADEAVVAMIEKIRCPFNVSAPAQAAALAALGDTGFLRRTVEGNAAERERAQAALDRLGARYAPSRANFMLIDVGDARAAFVSLMKAGYITRPAFGLPTHLRVTLGTRDEMAGFWEAFKGIIK